MSIDKQKLADLIKDVVLGNVPGGVRVVVGPLLDSLTAGLVRQIAGLAEPTFSHYVRIEHHGTPCLVGNWTTTSVNGGDAPGTGETWNWAPDGTVTIDYDNSEPDAAGVYFRGKEAGVVMLSAGNASATAGTFTENILYDDTTYYVDGKAYSPGPATPESGQWTCSGNAASITIVKANGPNVWDIERDAP